MSGTGTEFPVSFYFKVSFVSGQKDVSFKEVSGLNSEIELETIQEGGVNNFELKLPKQVKHNNLILKRALAPISGDVEKWIKECLEGNFSTPIKPDNIFIHLLNPDGEPLRGWVCKNAFPVKWEAEGFDSEKNGIVIETIEFSYHELERVM